MRPIADSDVAALLAGIDQARRLTRAAALLMAVALLSQHPLLLCAGIVGGLHALARLVALGWKLAR
ncbi:MAG: hypothetical protein IT532_00210 [Burkholderiales bacterium]|nr:hypothetical protein [Burkholderiales bacterium]